MLGTSASPGIRFTGQGRTMAARSGGGAHSGHQVLGATTRGAMIAPMPQLLTNNLKRLTRAAADQLPTGVRRQAARLVRMFSENFEQYLPHIDDDVKAAAIG